MKRCYYSDSIENFLQTSENSILGELVREHTFSTELPQQDAWLFQISFLKQALQRRRGFVYFEYAIPRMGRRIDVVVVDQNVIFVIEFKIGQKEFLVADIDQVWDYALDLKNFHETSHTLTIAPILIATEARSIQQPFKFMADADHLFPPIKSNLETFPAIYQRLLDAAAAEEIDHEVWAAGRYSPTPTIIEAATALYRKHSVDEISRKDASAKNLKVTSRAVSQIIADARDKREKSICFVTGVPGAGKTLVGLDIATKYLDASGGSQSVFLSGNGPLVNILTEALARDAINQEKAAGNKLKKGDARSRVKTFIQNVHHYRDEYIRDKTAPIDHVAIFDEAQRAWNHEKTADFMKRRKKMIGFTDS